VISTLISGPACQGREDIISAVEVEAVNRA
jgi:hypothetical protein